jgi:RNA polymerase sigma factor (sigma-70 family)
LNVDIEDWSEAEVFISEFSIETELILQEDQKQKVLRLNTLINALSARQREVIHLRFFDELDHDQIADMMGLNRQSVYNLLHETIRRLRNMWLIILIHII